MHSATPDIVVVDAGTIEGRGEAPSPDP